MLYYYYLIYSLRVYSRILRGILWTTKDFTLNSIHIETYLLTRRALYSYGSSLSLIHCLTDYYIPLDERQHHIRAQSTKENCLSISTIRLRRERHKTQCVIYEYTNMPSPILRCPHNFTATTVIDVFVAEMIYVVHDEEFTNNPTAFAKRLG